MIQTAGSALIAIERSRQITAEGYTAKHDDGHTAELIQAARAYLAVASDVVELDGEGPTRLDFEDVDFPWHQDYWKPTSDPIRDLTKAGALIAAAIDSLERSTQ